MKAKLRKTNMKTITQPTPQDNTITRLERQGWHFKRWIASAPDAEGCDHGTQTALMVRRTKFIHEYREVGPDGSIN